MKIGILTLPFNNNYGGYLQAYALMTILKKMGHEPTLILRRHNKINHSILFHVVYFIKSIIRSLYDFKYYPLIFHTENNFFLRGRKMITFFHRYMQPQTSFIYSTEELRCVCADKFDAYIVGSDQVWRPIYVPSIENFFLDFTKGFSARRIAYAASFGCSKPEYTDHQKEICGILISDFDAVSFREKTGLDIISKFKWNVPNKAVVLDPTMLLSKEEYFSLLPPKKSKAKNKVFCYILDDNNEVNKIINCLCSVSDKERFDFFNLQMRKNYYSEIPSIEDWLTGIRDAEYIVTDSFHGMVFSIIFNKPFFIYGNLGRGVDRFNDLLNDLGLENRMVYNYSDLKCAFEQEINWSIVNRKKEELKKISIEFLNQALS